MNRFVLIHMFFLLITFMFAFRAGAGDIPVPVKAKLVLDVAAVKPGSSFNAGVLFEIEPGWHIYWKNPGDSGLPTTVEFGLPAGFEVKKLGWPLPVVFRGEGNVTDFGYEDSLLLTAGVNVPSGLPPGSVVELTGKVSWVSCREICIPGRATLTLELPVSETVKGANADLFSEWGAKLPLNASGGKSPYNIEVETVAPDDSRTAVSISLSVGSDVGNIEFYPVPGNSLVVDNIRIESGSGVEETIISFDVSWMTGQKPSPPVMDTLVVFSSSDGRRSGIELPVMLDGDD